MFVNLTKNTRTDRMGRCDKVSLKIKDTNRQGYIKSKNQSKEYAQSDHTTFIIKAVCY